MFIKGESAMRTNKKNWLAFLLVCLPTLFGPAARAGDLCGTTIVEDLKLDQDLTCAGNGLIVGADGIKIKLDGTRLPETASASFCSDFHRGSHGSTQWRAFATYSTVPRRSTATGSHPMRWRFAWASQQTG